MWNEHDRRELAELIKADDRLRAERASEALRRPPVSESKADGLVYRTYENDAPAPAPVPEPRPSDDDELMHAFDVFSAEVTKRIIALATENNSLKIEIAELRGYVKAMRDERTGKFSNFEDLKTGEVVDLPKNFWRKPNAA